jgi:hypothetical protein
MAWTIPTQITGTTQVNQADNIIQANMNDLEDYINSDGDYVGAGLAEDQTSIVNTTSNQTITGIKTFSNGIVGNVTGVASSATTLTGLTSSVAELNILDGVTATASELNTLDGITATAAELNTLDGITATVTELNYTDGVTSSIQTQLNAKQATLVSGTNIKTVNGTSIVGSGNADLPHASSSVYGTVKAYVSGTTLYITL